MKKVIFAVAASIMVLLSSANTTMAEKKEGTWNYNYNYNYKYKYDNGDFYNNPYFWGSVAGVIGGLIENNRRPVYVEPTPEYVQPNPVYVQPNPVYVQPVPVCRTFWIEYYDPYYGYVVKEPRQQCQ